MVDLADSHSKQTRQAPPLRYLLLLRKVSTVDCKGKRKSSRTKDCRTSYRPGVGKALLIWPNHVAAQVGRPLQLYIRIQTVHGLILEYGRFGGRRIDPIYDCRFGDA